MFLYVYLKQRIALELEMTMYWHDYVISKHVLGDDNRTDYTLHNLNAEFLKRIWKPDLIFGKLIIQLFFKKKTFFLIPN